jgi:hypothetical protein
LRKPDDPGIVDMQIDRCGALTLPILIGGFFAKVHRLPCFTH